MRRNTIDLDCVSEEDWQRIVVKIKECRFHGTVKVRDTLKGYHLTFICKRDCDLCRLAFDDPVRYSRDLERERVTRNVLFDRKVYKGRRIL